MATFAELLDAASRDRLAEVVHADLIAAAQDAVAESFGIGRLAWCAVVVALSHAVSVQEARDDLGDMITDEHLRILAKVCLASISNDQSRNGDSDE